MKKKILALCLVVVLAVTAVTGATLAYFTDTAGEMTNTFTVGKVDIKLDEANLATEAEDDRTETGNTYEDIYPGVILDKDPTVTVIGGSEDSYVRMKVKVEVETLAAAFPADNGFADYWGEDGVFLLQKLVDWNTDWEYEACDDGVYEFRYNEIVEEAEDDTKLEALFTKITIPAELTNAQISALEDFEVVVTAEAIQAATFADADAAWTAFEGAKAEEDIDQNFNEKWNDTHIEA